MVDALPVLGQTALIQIKQPLDIVHQIFFEQIELFLRGREFADSRYFSAHQVSYAHELVLVELLIVLGLDCGVDVLVVAVTDVGFGKTTSSS